MLPGAKLGDLGAELLKLWERYEVTGRKYTRKAFHHPRVGALTLSPQSMELEGTPGQRLGVYLAEPGTPDYDALLLLDMTTPPIRHPAPPRSGTTTPTHLILDRSQGQPVVGVTIPTARHARRH